MSLDSAASERALTADERDELTTAAQAAMAELQLDGDPGDWVKSLCARASALPNKDRDAAVFELGALLGACFEMALGWELVEVVWPELVALAAVNMDRSLVVLPLQTVAALAEGQALDVPGYFQRLQDGQTPPDLVRGRYALLLP